MISLIIQGLSEDCLRKVAYHGQNRHLMFTHSLNAFSLIIGVLMVDSFQSSTYFIMKSDLVSILKYPIS